MENRSGRRRGWLGLCDFDNHAGPELGPGILRYDGEPLLTEISVCATTYSPELYRQEARMTELLKELTAQMENVNLSGTTGPAEEVGKRDHIVGVMSDGLKRLWVVRDQAHDTLMSVRRDVFMAGSAAKSRAEFARILATFEVPFVAASQRVDVLNRLFWASVRHEFSGECSKANIDIREGWQVVWIEEEDKLTVGGLIEALLARSDP